MGKLSNKFRKFFDSKEIPLLYDYQSSAIQSLLSKKNSLVVAPTGSGKSLIFQIAAIELGDTTIVVSPLKALMQEQVNDLNRRGLNAIAITSDIPFQEQRKILRTLGSKKYDFIYVSPERLQNYFFRAALLHSNCRISQLVIDEAHCISQWGFDFRPEYGEIRGFLNFLLDNKHNPVICALTATLSPKAVLDIKSEFSIDDESYSNTENIIRPELKLNFLKVEDKSAENEKWNYLLDFIRSHNSKKILVYFYSRKKSEELCNKFNAETPIPSYQADYFHSGLDGEQKLEKYETFRKGKINILFATTAFGMGMNIPDIDCIIQYHLPKSIEEYYQQVGRGARDRSICPTCNCLLFWSEKNIESNIREIESERFTEEKILKGYEHLGLEEGRDKISAVQYSELRNSKINLPKLKFILEKFNIIETLGEINGGPDTIRFFSDTILWHEIKNKSVANSFIITAKKMNKSVQGLINYIFEQDLLGNIEYIPAMDKKIFIKPIADAFSKKIIDKILEDDYEKNQFRMDRFLELGKLCKVTEPNKFLNSVFKVRTLNLKQMK